jgi:hypothetical protein
MKDEQKKTIPPSSFLALGISAQVFVRDRIVVSGDAAATAANILESVGNSSAHAT